ncbi:Golgi SNAP receptor complex member, putative [Candida dubliniensis CD36]|uniref:Golgi SNAP receptor complex member 1 n=1 Tax=Candida dubliniensis (strain CD36 / ATCC MYA-646 / CBS 7987 / NCPF 3949 / NRRL Y-17841) TaxID=573826 RepID=B9WK59_CANDC|nr:Golgi SNAP receptor complex member, putative [Candida dubliniensis CD36]CAX40710.1 Golgi SNAP receptor complex member, putative [Candida dubliniensis CD36]
MSSSTFTQTRSRALSLEKQTEQLLSKFSQFQQQQQQNQSQSLDITQEEITIRQQIEEIFQKRDAIISKLNRISEVEPNLSTSKLQQLTRHKEKLNDDNLSFTKIINNIEDERNKNNLLFNVHRDINHHKQQRNLDGNAYILEESERVNNVNSIADRLLQGAFATRDELLNQRQYLNNAQSQVASTMQNIPGLNVLISKINTRRKRDTLILASVIAICILFLFFV